MWKNIAAYSGIQILSSVLTIVAQYIFVNYTYYESFTRLYATSLWGTLILRIVFGITFTVSGCLGAYTCYKKSTMSILLTLVATAISTCTCLILLGESAICATYIVSRMEEKTDIKSISSAKNKVLNIEIEIGEDSNEIVFLPEHQPKLLLALFSTQLTVCLIQGVIIILFFSDLNKYLKEMTTLHSYIKKKPEIGYKEILSTAI